MKLKSIKFIFICLKYFRQKLRNLCIKQVFTDFTWCLEFVTGIFVLCTQLLYPEFNLRRENNYCSNANISINQLYLPNFIKNALPKFSNILVLWYNFLFKHQVRIIREHKSICFGKWFIWLDKIIATYQKNTNNLR